MRSLLFALVLGCASFSLCFAQEAGSPLTPAEAGNKVNEVVTVEMEVKSSALREGVCFLNSELKHRDPANLTIFIDRKAIAKFKAAQIEDPAEHYKSKTIRVKGKVELHRERPEIKIDGPDDISLVEAK